MRRNYISPEFRYTPVFGTFNMEEESCFFGSKMLEIEDMIDLTDDVVVYNENLNNEQLDLQVELDFPSKNYNLLEDKRINHKLTLNQFQSQIEKLNYAKWVLDINIKQLFNNYLFSILKENRTFEGIKNEMTINRSVDTALRDYIKRNVYNRYTFSNVELYIVPINLLSPGAYKLKNVWDPTIKQTINKFNKFTTETDLNGDTIKLFFSQEFPASQYAFKYYYDLKMVKI